VADLISDDERGHMVLACVSYTLGGFVTSLPNIVHYYWWYNTGQNIIEMGLCCISGMFSSVGNKKASLLITQFASFAATLQKT